VTCSYIQYFGSSAIDVAGESSRPPFVHYLLVPKVDSSVIDVTGESPRPPFVHYLIVPTADMDL
jgi:hypothetical protein